MTEETATKRDGVLSRKLNASREDSDTMKGSFTLKGLRRGLARAAQDLCELPLAVLAARQGTSAPEDLPGLLSDDHLLVVLDRADGRCGAVTMDAALVTALIQKQTIGQLMGQAPAERVYTPTDAAMSAEFLETAFGKIVDLLDGQPDQPLFEGFRFGAQVEDVRNLTLGLEADTYRVISLNLDIAVGAMQGQIIFVLPEPKVETTGAQAGGPSLGRNMGAMRAELSAVLCKMKLPLNDFSSLKVGDILPLDQAFLYETDLVAVGGQVIAQGRLGQLNGARAVRMNEPRTKLVEDTDAADLAFSSAVAIEDAGMDEEMPSLDLGIAAEDLQDPMGGGDFPAMGGLDNAGELGGLGGDLGGDFGLGGDADLPAMGDLGGDLGADLGGGLPGADGLGADMPGLGDGGFGEFNPDDAAAEIEKLAGLET